MKTYGPLSPHGTASLHRRVVVVFGFMLVGMMAGCTDLPGVTTAPLVAFLGDLLLVLVQSEPVIRVYQAPGPEEAR